VPKLSLIAAGSDPEELLSRAEEVILPDLNGRTPPGQNISRNATRVGVDPGTAYTVLVVLDEQGKPLVGESKFTRVVRDGLVVDFIGAVDILRAMKKRLEARIGKGLTHAASGFRIRIPKSPLLVTSVGIAMHDRQGLN